MRVIALFFLSLTLIIGCSNSEENIDPKLVGEWYKVENPGTFSSNTPQQVYTGWRITKDGGMDPLGVESATGKLALIDTRYLPEIGFANSGKMEVTYFAHPNVDTEVIRYSIRNNMLILEGRFAAGTYIRSKLSSKIAPATPADFSVHKGEEILENVKVDHRVPTAYITRESNSEWVLHAEMKWQRISIQINDFIGTGTYSIGKDQANYSTFGTDWIGPTFTSPEDSGGTVIIADCNAQNTRCSGEFNFRVNNVSWGAVEDTTWHSFTSGSFDLPVY
ncbi:DUF6252 family protein [Gracilimonas mengyeensis]|uniref:Lipocalin-like domain-containing protein n=1 Tax=Gracilimonas mengyeensis TaxID=1302730 RepID=A0A521FLL5_9BACT|nr:DUF6252 family protein [Gracilimonas mengyeensis]SMO97039.1 hypothetical protein SAMN06265219_12223 [Gracilimonas mengyeensis]